MTVVEEDTEQPARDGKEPALGKGRRLMPSVPAGRTVIERHEMEQFARRLHETLIRKGMSQSDLARSMWGETTDARGYKVARNRDRVSSYLSGRSWPEAQNLRRMAEALGVKEEDLAPDITAATVDREKPALAITMVAGHPDKVHLVVDQLVPLALAARIASLLSDEGEKKA